MQAVAMYVQYHRYILVHTTPYQQWYGRPMFFQGYIASCDHGSKGYVQSLSLEYTYSDQHIDFYLLLHRKDRGDYELLLLRPSDG